MSKAYEVITDRIISMIDKGVCPWRMPWSKSSQLPQSNGTSGKAYQGCNQFIAAVVSMSEGYSSPYWFTYKQAQELGGQVRKGEKSIPILFFKKLEIEDRITEEKKEIPFANYSCAFNADQIDGLDDKFYPKAVSRPHAESIAACDAIVDEFEGKPDIVVQGEQAFYRPSEDRVFMPKQVSFFSDEEYYNTLFHELGHSTGHSKRLARKSVIDPTAFGSHQYGVEELVAEMTAAFLCQHAGIDAATIDNSAAYLDGWRKRIKEDVKMIATAAAQAQKAANFIRGIRVNENAESEMVAA